MKYGSDKIVLNLIINGIPSIPEKAREILADNNCFKPYYKWNTFNTSTVKKASTFDKVLNLIINGIPSILSQATPAVQQRQGF